MQLKANGPVKKADEPLSWKIAGNAAVTDFAISGLNRLTATLESFDLRDRKLDFSGLSVARDGPQSFHATVHGKADLVDGGAVELRFQADDLPLDQLAQTAGLNPKSSVDGKVDVRGAFKTAYRSSTPASETLPELQLEAQLASPKLTVAGINLGLIEHRLTCADKQFRLRPLVARTTADQPHIASMKSDQEADSNKVIPNSALPSNMLLKSITGSYEDTEAGFSIRDFTADAFGGKVSGQATLFATEGHREKVAIQWNDLSPEIELVNPINDQVGRFEFTTTGHATWSIQNGDYSNPNNHQGDSTIEVSDLTLSGQALGQFAAVLAFGPQVARLDIEGKLFGGSISVATGTRTDQVNTWRQLLMRLVGKAVLEEIAIEELVRSSARDSTLSGYDGRISCTTGWTRLNSGPLATQSTLVLKGVRRRGVKIADRLNGQILSKGTAIHLQSLSGTFAEGTLFASGRWYLGAEPGTLGAERGTLSAEQAYLGAEPGNSSKEHESNPSGSIPSTDHWTKNLIQIRLSRANASRALLPINTRLPHWFGGNLSLRGNLTSSHSLNHSRPSLRFSGSVEIDDSTLFDLPSGDARSTLIVRYQTDQNRWSANFPSVHSSVARGHLNGSIKLGGTGRDSGSFDLQSRWRINHVDFQDVLSTYANGLSVGHGNVTGDVRIGGQHLQNAKDLQGEFRFVLGGTDATAVPGLSTAGTLMGAASLGDVTFDEGHATGRIDRGQIRFDELVLASDRLGVQAEGRVDYLNRRMQINAMMATGDFRGQTNLVERFGLQTLIAATPFAEINQLLSDRALVFQLTGPTRDPIVRVLPAETARANAIRFIRQELTGAIIADSLLFD